MKGILFTPEMARAACAGTKTITRRVIVPQPTPSTNGYDLAVHWHPWELRHGLKMATGTPIRCDYVAGERRCLLTTWAVASQFDDRKPTELSPRTSVERIWHAGLGTSKPNWCGKSRPGRFLANHLRPLMPVFEIVSVRAERVQNITDADARAEGVTIGKRRADSTYPPRSIYDIPMVDETPREAFARLWDSINQTRGFDWASNPWVWRVEFKKVTP